MNYVFLSGMVAGVVLVFVLMALANVAHDYCFYRESHRFSRLHALRKAAKELRDIRLFTF